MMLLHSRTQGRLSVTGTRAAAAISAATSKAGLLGRLGVARGVRQATMTTTRMPPTTVSGSISAKMAS